VENLEPRKRMEKEIELSRSFSLGEGVNLIEVVAYNSKNLIASVPATVSLAVAAPASVVQRSSITVAFS
jgi:hypothetical protein